LVLPAPPVLRLQNWFRWLVKLLRCFIPEVGIACASSFALAKLVPLVGKVTALFYAGSWYCLRLQL
jgi:hypothetical protein